ncbi:unnamed protein product [Discosporangium mesarthrocarpum]
MGQPVSAETKDEKVPCRRRSINEGFVTRAHRNVDEKYKIDTKPLGRGHYGVVRRCINIETGETLALKTIRKARVARMDNLSREIQILKTVKHPNIIQLVDVFEDEKNLHLVTELCEGGELFDRIIQKTESEEGAYSERDAALLISKILSAIAYCHDEHNICHRDLKPENFLFKSEDEDSELKIIDFGLSRFEETNTNMTTRVGTPYCEYSRAGRSVAKNQNAFYTLTLNFFFFHGSKLKWYVRFRALTATVEASMFSFFSPSVKTPTTLL